MHNYVLLSMLIWTFLLCLQVYVLCVFLCVRGKVCVCVIMIMFVFYFNRRRKVNKVVY